MFRYLILAVLCFGLIAAGPKSRKSRKDIVRRQNNACGENEFQCHDGDCIDADWTCDTEDDCLDRSDETLPECPPPGQCTGSHELLCNDNVTCTSRDYVCDGVDDCPDNGDERNCDLFECPSLEWKCPNGLCIEGYFVCDGEDDCGDGADETPAACAATPVTSTK